MSKRMIVVALAVASAITGAVVIGTTQTPMTDYGNSITSKEWQEYRHSDRWTKSLTRLGISDSAFQQKWAHHFESLRRQERERRMGIMAGILAVVGMMYLVAVSVK